jgi:hypothetical protein
MSQIFNHFHKSPEICISAPPSPTPLEAPRIPSILVPMGTLLPSEGIFLFLRRVPCPRSAISAKILNHKSIKNRAHLSPSLIYSEVLYPAMVKH